MISDFGLAKDLDHEQSLTQTGAIVGTPSFMPPEQAASNRGLIGPASDVYSLGAILYNCLTGRPPFQAATRVDTLFLVLDQDPVPPRLLNPAVDRDLEIICLKCLQKAPEMRYASAADLAEDLEAFLAGESLSIGPSELRDLIGRLLRPTHHITILENWGGLWMAHSLFTLLLCIVTWLMDRPVLQFAPLLAVMAAMVFLCKAGILSGLFYLATGALFAAAALMAWLPDWAMLIYGVTLAASYFIPGLVFYRRRRNSLRTSIHPNV